MDLDLFVITATPKDVDFFMEVYNDSSFLNQNERNDPIQNKIHADFILKNGFDNWNIIYTQKEIDNPVEKDGATIYYVPDKRVGILNIFNRPDGLYFGISIHKDYRRRKYAEKAIRLFLIYNDLKKVNTYLEVFEDNFAKKLYEKLGYKDTKDFKIIRNRKFRKMFRKHQ